MSETLLPAVAAALLAALALVGWLRRMVHRGLAPARIAEVRTPADHGLIHRDIRLPAANGKTLFGWLIPAPGGPDAPAVVAIHGWGGNAETLLLLARPLHEASLTLLLIDARCHGRSDEDDFTSLPRFAEDLDSAVAWLRREHAVAAGRIALLGHSVGAGAALLAASRRSDIAAVVSIAAFSHPVAMMRRWFAIKHIPYLPFGWLMLRYIEHVIGHRFDAIAPVNTIAAVCAPTLLVHGDRDDTVPPDEARMIHAARGGDHVALRIIPGSHDDFADGADIAGELAVLTRFLRRTLRPETPGAPQEAVSGATVAVPPAPTFV